MKASFWIASITLICLVIASMFHWPDAIGPKAISLAAALLAGLVGLEICCHRSSRSNRAVFGLLALAAIGPCGALWTAAVVLPSMDESRSWRAVAEAIDERRGPRDAVANYRLRPYVDYYVRQGVVNFRKPDDLTSLVRQYEAVWCAVRPRHLNDLRRFFHVRCDLHATYPSPKGQVQVVRLQPFPQRMPY